MRNYFVDLSDKLVTSSVNKVNIGVRGVITAYEKISSRLVPIFSHHTSDKNGTKIDRQPKLFLATRSFSIRPHSTHTTRVPVIFRVHKSINFKCTPGGVEATAAGERKKFN